MEQPQDRKEGFADIVRKRKKLVNLTSIPFFVVAAAALLARIGSGRFLGIPFSVSGPLAIIVFLVTLVLHLMIWRCPACGGYLGIVGLSKFCPKCGVGLDADPPREGGTPKSPDRTGNPGLGFKLWTSALSVFVAVMLYPNIVRRHGPAKSLLITFLAVAAVWLMYFVIGQVIDAAVSEELKRRSHRRPDDKGELRP